MVLKAAANIYRRIIRTYTSTEDADACINDTEPESAFLSEEDIASGVIPLEEAKKQPPILLCLTQHVETHYSSLVKLGSIPSNCWRCEICDYVNSGAVDGDCISCHPPKEKSSFKFW